jgi:hypothetical protein
MNAYRLFCKCHQTDAMSETFLGIMHIVITDGSVTGDSVVPDADCAIVPFDADLQISGNGNVLYQFTVLALVI